MENCVEISPGPEIISLKNWFCRRCLKHVRQAERQVLPKQVVETNSDHAMMHLHDLHSVQQPAKSIASGPSIIFIDSDSDDSVIPKSTKISPKPSVSVSSTSHGSLKALTRSDAASNALVAPGLKSTQSLPFKPHPTPAAPSTTSLAISRDGLAKPSGSDINKDHNLSQSIASEVSNTEPSHAAVPQRKATGLVTRGDNTQDEQIARYLDVEEETTTHPSMKVAYRSARKTPTSSARKTPATTASTAPSAPFPEVGCLRKNPSISRPLSDIIEWLHSRTHNHLDKNVTNPTTELNDQYGLVAPHIYQWIQLANQPGNTGEPASNLNSTPPLSRASKGSNKTRKNKARKFDADMYDADLLTFVRSKY
ncbi:hypothetical protein D9757_003489 [Collybiopsis confluens]|uniref:Uncharacterized protein n=1 Tax=Collybiopsis confluens TaxID=2823264 RepID=A0A8H5MCS9_9AGAR|nr:hypothetical protein D9757_003489 [Collybiopsis confluens]